MTDVAHQQPTIFVWDTLTKIGRFDLPYINPVEGSEFELDLIGGEKIKVWQAKDQLQYFCHGLTFGGKSAPFGPISPFSGKSVETILAGYFEEIADEANATANDILVWNGTAPNSTPHSAILYRVELVSGKNCIDESKTELRTKNGMLPESTLLLSDLFDEYGEWYNIYKKNVNEVIENEK